MDNIDNSRTKELVAKMLSEGVSVSEIQKRLSLEYQIKMTFLDLKLLLSEIENIGEKIANGEKEEEEAPEDKIEKEGTDSEHEEVNAELMDGGETVIEVEKLIKPGAALSGTVKFASGVKASWSVDNYGRLSLQNATGKPTPEDLKGFQQELHRKLGG